MSLISNLGYLTSKYYNVVPENESVFAPKQEAFVWNLPTIIIASIIVVYCMVCYFFLLRKAGFGGWQAFVPILNVYFIFKMVFGNAKLFFVVIPVTIAVAWLNFPIVTIIYNIFIFAFSIAFNIRLGECFSKYGGYVVVMNIFAIIFWGILAFGKDEYRGPLYSEKHFNENLKDTIFN